MINHKKVRKTDEEKQQLILDLVMMDDVMFESICEDPMAVEEILQTMLENPGLRIKPDTLVAQKSIKNLKGRSIRMDAYVVGMEEKVFNIEIQKSDHCNHIKRVRYNASVITANNSEPGDEFDDIQDLCIIYVTSKDIFHKGYTTYHVQNTIRETGDIIQDGLEAVYINAEVKDGSKISKLMEAFQCKELDEDIQNLFPNTSRKFQSLKHDEREVKSMCDKVEAYARKHAEEYAREEAIRSVIEALKNVNLPKEKILSCIIQQFNIQKTEAEQYYNKVCEDAE